MTKTRVRIAVAITSNGDWHSGGYNDEEDRILQAEANFNEDPDVVFYWIEADIPIPEAVEPPVIEGEVTK